MRALVLADGTTILADDFYTYICSETLVRAVRYGRLSAKLLRRIARNRARDFWRLAENYPLGLAQYDQRAVEPEPVRRDEYNADVIGVDALEYNNHIADALQGLSLRQRRVVAALAWGCTLREVAAVLGVSLATAQRDRAAAERALRRSRH
jgi:DNA-directed RNA polymerase specialized sigma24 family protein